MKVFVVMQNDYPRGVFSTQENADRFVTAQQSIVRPYGMPPIFWNVYAFELDARTPWQ